MDTLIEKVGGWGRFQLIMVGSVKLGLMSVAWNMLQMSFVGIVPSWWCLPPPSYHDHHGNLSLHHGYYGNLSFSEVYHGNSSLHHDYHGNWSRDNRTYQKCEIPESGGESCSAYLVFDQSVATVINQWSLVCDLAYVKRLMTSAQMGGVMLGALLAGQASDFFGRRPTIYFTMLCLTVTSLVAAFSVTWHMFVAMRGAIGISIGSYLVSAVSYPLEFVSPKYRQVVGFIPGWTAGISIFALMAWLAPNWRYLHIGSALLGVPFLLTWFVTPESVRWLAVRGRMQEAERVIERVARVNGRKKPEGTMHTLQHVVDKEKETGQGRRYTYIDVYRGWRMALSSLTLNAIWFSMALSYYTIAFGVSALSGNVYLNIFLMGLLEVPANLSTIFLANGIGRRWTCLLFLLLCAMASFGIVAIHWTVAEDDQGKMVTALAMVSRMSVGAGWLVMTIFTSEIYPTVIRNLGIGSSSTVSRLGSTLAPLLLNMDTAQDVARGFLVMGCLVAASGVAVLFLKETNGKGLEDSVTVVKTTEETDKVKNSGEGEGQFPRGDAELSVWTVAGEERTDGALHSSLDDPISHRL